MKLADLVPLKENSISRLKDKVKDMSKEDFIALVKKVGDLDKWKNASKGKFDDGTPIRPFSNAGDRVEVIDNNFEEKEAEKYLTPLKEGSMQARELADRNSSQQLQSMYDQLMRDMEQEAEPEGGPIADQYADQMHDIEQAMQMKRSGDKFYGKSKPMTYDQAIGRVSRDDFEKSSKFKKAGERSGFDMRGLNEATEKSWSAIDVSRKAEKEIDNKEWNSRTTKKLDMLIALNKAGKFKKDWGEEKLQGWVDQNYSWEKLARQFKNINEMKNKKQKNLLTERFQELAGIKPLYQEAKGYEGDSPMPFRDNPDANDEFSKKRMAQDSAMVKKVVNLKMDSEVGAPVTIEYDPKKNLRDVRISWLNPKTKAGESHTVDFEAGDTIDDHGNEGMDIETSADSDDGRWQFILDVYVGYQFDMTGDYEEWDFDELIVQGHPDNEDHLDPEDRFDQDPMEEDVDEGSCGYGPDGVPGDTPGETKGMPADRRTMSMMREVIKKEISKLKNPKKADLDKDGKLSSYEKTRGSAIEKNIGKR